jgi:hypothetical protein
MVATVQVDDSRAELLLTDWLKGAGFSGFCLDTSFELRFSREQTNQGEGALVPSQLRLRIESEWWFDDRDAWIDHVATKTVRGSVDPEEPVQAFELACLRWAEGATVEHVSVTVGVLRVRFANGRTITATSGEEEDSIAWLVGETGIDETQARWSVACEQGRIFARWPSVPEDAIRG